MPLGKTNSETKRSLPFILQILFLQRADVNFPSLQFTQVQNVANKVRLLKLSVYTYIYIYTHIYISLLSWNTQLFPKKKMRDAVLNVFVLYVHYIMICIFLFDQATHFAGQTSLPIPNITCKYLCFLHNFIAQKYNSILANN